MTRSPSRSHDHKNAVSQPSGTVAAARETGSATVEMVIVIPVFMVVILVAVQLCLWVLADEAVQQVASRSATVAAGLGGTVASGQEAGLVDAASVAGPLLEDPHVTVTVSTGAERAGAGAGRLESVLGGRSGAQSVTATASGRVEPIVAWWQLTVRAERRATVQRFREVP